MVKHLSDKSEKGGPMRLYTFRVAEEERIGALLDDGRMMDLAAAERLTGRERSGALLQCLI